MPSPTCTGSDGWNKEIYSGFSAQQVPASTSLQRPCGRELNLECSLPGISLPFGLFGDSFFSVRARQPESDASGWRRCPVV